MESGAQGRAEPAAESSADRGAERGDVPLRATLRRVVVALSILVAATVPTSARGAPNARHAPLEHEPIPADPANDVAFGLHIDGELPAALATRSGLVNAPDPRAPLPGGGPFEGTAAASLAGQNDAAGALSRFTPDTDTRRPDTLPYSDPFVPSTAPWKRLAAFDAVDADYALRVADSKLEAVPLLDPVRADGSEDQFYGDIVVDLRNGELTRIPSVGPGARIVHARLGVGPENVEFEVLRDSAANWFLRSPRDVRARLVYELTIPRAVFGGAFREPFDSRIPLLGPRALPANVQRDALMVAKQIGVPRDTRRATIEALVEYFRGFTESNEPPPAARNVYVALSLSKRGVCRHRAYAFMVTALGIGIPTRVVMNEAHAWVEVWDGPVWKRVDLGGAGSILDEATDPEAPAYAPPPDPFQWPVGARRGDDLGRTASLGNGGEASSGATWGALAAPSGSGAGSAPSRSVAPSAEPAPTDARPIPQITIRTTETRTVRGQPVHVEGEVVADGASCAHVAVEILVRDEKTGDTVPLGELATDERGTYVGGVVVPRGVVVGEYELVASTEGDTRCGAARSR